MKAFISGMACISHYDTLNEDYFFEDVPTLPATNQMLALEPSYKDWIPANTARRMSHIIKMGVTAAKICLQKAGLENVDAIVTGTGLGCIDDTNKFLGAMLNNEETMLAPTSFIQSTHNTVGGQIALLLQCHGYNNNYVHQQFSFEHALTDALMLLKEDDSQNILVGGIDELSPQLFELLDRTGKIKKMPSTETLWESTTPGFIAGESATFFTLSGTRSKNSIAQITGVTCLLQVNSAPELEHTATLFLQANGLDWQQIDLVLSGDNGDSAHNQTIKQFNKLINKPVAYFKLLGGESYTASAFGAWLATRIISLQKVPAAIVPGFEIPGNISNILIVNTCDKLGYSLICLGACEPH